MPRLCLTNDRVPTAEWSHRAIRRPCAARGGRHEWCPGHWELRRTGMAWEPAHWMNVGGRWRFIPGHWRPQ